MGPARHLGVEVTDGPTPPDWQRALLPVTDADASGLGGSPLGDLIARRARPHEQMGGRPTPYLRRAALVADVVLIAMILIGNQIHAQGVRKSSFFPVGGDLVADIIDVLQAVAWPLFLVALASLALNWWSGRQRTREGAHVVLAVQVVPAAIVGLGWLTVAALFVIMLAIWIAVIGVIAALVAAAVVGAAAGANS